MGGGRVGMWVVYYRAQAAMLANVFQGIFQIGGFPQGSLVGRGQPSIENLSSALRVWVDIFH